MVSQVAANAGDVRDSGLILGWGRSSGEGHGNSLQYPCLENPMDRGAWWATVHKVTKSLHDWNDLAYKQYYIGRGRNSWSVCVVRSRLQANREWSQEKKRRNIYCVKLCSRHSSNSNLAQIRNILSVLQMRTLGLREVMYLVQGYTAKDMKWSESEVAQLCPTLCDPVDCSPPGFSVHGILQARILEWVATPFSRGSS